MPRCALLLLAACGPASDGAPAPRGEVPADDVAPSPTLRRVALDPARFPDAVCNDGTPGIFYLREGHPTSTRWVVALEGGGACETERKCRRRLRERPELTSSDPRWHPPTITLDGLLTVDDERSPLLADAHHVFVPYCSSDWWLGDRGPVPEHADLHFRGHRILVSVLEALTADHGLDEGTDLLLAGGSAGGIGVELNVDLVAREVVPHLEVRGLQDAMWPVDLAAVRPEDYWRRLDPVEEGEAHGVWDTPVYDRCLADTGGDPRCFDRFWFVQRLQTPMFVRNAQRDPFLEDAVRDEARRWDLPWDAQLATMLLVASLEELDGRHAVFAPDGEVHVTLDQAAFTEERVGGVTAMELLEGWLDGSITGEAARRIE